MSDSTRDRWERIWRELDALMALPIGARRSHLDRLAARDAQLHADLAAILAVDESLGGPIERADGLARRRFVGSFRERSTRASEPSADWTAGLQSVVRDGIRDAIDELPGDDAPRYAPGTVLSDRYRIVGPLGRGGMGEVYRAEDLKLGQTVALKFVSASLDDGPGHIKRLVNEVRLARRVSHPNVCRVFDIGEFGGRHFISMEYIDGEDLASLLRRTGKLPADRALRIALELCAGLAAAHEQTILHRDLKPSNIMLDGRGRVRITDFGLAETGRAVVGRRAREGTPSYQAPEQLDGREASVRSDIYALGLVLHELFTGRRRVQGDTPRSDGSAKRAAPRNLASLMGGVDPAVELAILACSEAEPADRPPSVLAVMASLPGGDPLAAAIAAGEIPSADLVAAAGPRGALSRRAAVALVSVLIGLQLAVLAVADRASVLGWMPRAKSPDVLEENAERIRRTVGYLNAPVDWSVRIKATDYFEEYTRHVGRASDRPDRWSPIREPGELTTGFEYRCASRPLVPVGWNGQVEGFDDPPPRPGDAVVVTDLRGRLMLLRAVPDASEVERAGAGAPDWAALFSLAGLDIARFQPLAPNAEPQTHADNRVSWKGVLAEFGDTPVRIDAAALGALPVSFSIAFDWGGPTDADGTSWVRAGRVLDSYLRVYLLPAALVFTVLVSIVLAVRNWRSGRADRAGALRVGVVVFGLRVAWWCLGGHHVPELRGETELLLRAVASALTGSAIAWCLYLAMEPYARLHPSFVIAWTRLVHGRFRDPLVGRDLLLGLTVGTASFLVRHQLSVAVPVMMGWPGPPPVAYPGPPWIGQPLSLPMLGGRHLVAELALAPLSAFSAVFAFITLLLALRVVFRFDRLALVVFVFIFAMIAPPWHSGGYTVASVATGLIAAAAWAWMLDRLGFVASLGGVIVWHVYEMLPLTGDPGARYFGTGLAGALCICALAIFAARTASEG